MSTHVISIGSEGTANRSTASVTGEIAAALRQPLNGQFAALTARIGEYEREYGLNSADLKDALDAGKIAESHEVCRWLGLIRIRDRLDNAATRGARA